MAFDHIEKDLILNSMTEQVAFLDTGLKVLSINKAVTLETGFDEQSVKGLNCRDMWKCSEDVCESCNVKETLRTGIPGDGEITTQDGRIWNVKSYPVRENDSVTGVVMMIVDVTVAKLINEDIKRFAKDLWFRNEIAMAFLSEPDENVFEKLSEILLLASQSKHGIVGIIEEESGQPVFPDIASDTSRLIKEKTCLKGLSFLDDYCQNAIKHNSIIIENNISEKVDEDFTLTRFIIAPISFKSSPFGIILLCNKEMDYDSEDSQIVETLAQQIAPVLHFRLKGQKEEAEKAELEKNLMQAQKMETVGILAGGIAHDFNNMLGVIIGSAHLALSDLEPDNPVISEINRIVAASKKAKDVSMKLLTFARKRKLLVSEISANNIIEKALKSFEEYANDNVTVIRNFAADIPSINVDTNQMHQAIINICTNSAEALPNGGTIKVSTAIDEPGYLLAPMGSDSEAPTRFLKIEIEDDGCGMEDEVLSRIYEPFYTTKEMGKGAGLGMAIVFGVVKNHNGQISAESKPGRGTTVKILLPLSPTDVKSSQPETGKTSDQKKAADKPADKQTILIVDDEEYMVELAERILKKDGYKILTATHGDRALEIFDEHSETIDLVLLDVVMPGRNGRKIFNKMKEVKPDVRVIFFSGYSNDGTIEEIIPPGGTGFIQKPFDIPEFRNIIRQSLS